MDKEELREKIAKELFIILGVERTGLSSAYFEYEWGITPDKKQYSNQRPDCSKPFYYQKADQILALIQPADKEERVKELRQILYPYCHIIALTNAHTAPEREKIVESELKELMQRIDALYQPVKEPVKE